MGLIQKLMISVLFDEITIGAVQSAVLEYFSYTWLYLGITVRDICFFVLASEGDMIPCLNFCVSAV